MQEWYGNYYVYAGNMQDPRLKPQGSRRFLFDLCKNSTICNYICIGQGDYNYKVEINVQMGWLDRESGEWIGSILIYHVVLSFSNDEMV